MAKKKDVLCIMGFAPSSIDEGLQYVIKNQERSELWVMNDFYRVIPQHVPLVTRWFEIHDREYYADLRTDNEQGKQHIKALNSLPMPVYVQDAKNYDDIKNQVYFPAKEMIKFFGEDIVYYTNTPSWLVAFALYEALKEAGVNKLGDPIDKDKFKWKEIRLYGVDMQMGWGPNIQNEYAMQRPSCEWILGWVKGLQLAGVPIKLYVPKASSLLKRFGVYGYETEDERQVKFVLEQRNNFLDKKKTEMTNQMKQMESQLRQMQMQLNNIAGSKAENDFMQSYT
jgi:hypothetical protein